MDEAALWRLADRIGVFVQESWFRPSSLPRCTIRAANVGSVAMMSRNATGFNSR